jgi:hypothetical protein
MTILSFFAFMYFTSECPVHKIHNSSVQGKHSTFPPYPLKDENLLLRLSLIIAQSFQINDPGGVDKLHHSCLTKTTHLCSPPHPGTKLTSQEWKLQIHNIANVTKPMREKFPSMHVRNQSQYTLQSLIINERRSSLLQSIKQMYKTKVQEICPPKHFVAHQDISL